MENINKNFCLLYKLHVPIQRECQDHFFFYTILYRIHEKKNSLIESKQISLSLCVCVLKKILWTELSQ